MRTLAFLGFFLWTQALGAASLTPSTDARPAEFQLPGLSGGVHRLTDYRGKVVLVNFWASWCEPCREEMPSLERLKTRFAGRPFVVLAVNVDEPEARIRKFLSVLPLSFPVLLDQERRVSKAWQVTLLPSTYVVAPDGKIRYRVRGELDWNADEVAARIAELLPAR